MMRVGSLADIECLFTNEKPSDAFLQKIKEADVTLVIA